MTRMDVRAVTGIETYVNDEPDDDNPGIIIDTRSARTKALTSEETRALASELWERAAYFDDLTRKRRAADDAEERAALNDNNDYEE